MIAILSMAPIFCLVASPIAAQQSEKSPDQELPPHITRLTLFGERADWSHDGKRLLFLSKTYGDVFETVEQIELQEGVIVLGIAAHSLSSRKRTGRT